MSLWIDPSRVTAVLLADGWHACTGFLIDAFEFVDGGDGELLYGGGVGFAFTHANGDAVVSGPMTSVLAVREDDI